MSNRICIITACWKRPKVLRAALDNWRTLGVDHIVCAHSPGDRWAPRILKQFDAVPVEAPNKLGVKFNAASLAAKDIDADYYLHMGADDLFDQKVMFFYRHYNGPHMGFVDYYFHHLPTGATRYWPGYAGERYNEPIGAGKLVHRSIMEKIGWTPFTAGRDKSLDHDQHVKLSAVAQGDLVSIRTLGVSIDLKDENSATAWDKIDHVTDTAAPLRELSPFIHAFVDKHIRR